jgi:hypothetical protein
MKNQAKKEARKPRRKKPTFLPLNRDKKIGRLLTSHRYNRLPLLPSDPGGVQQELVVQDLPAQR